jgi:hypothetical protein
MPQNTTKRFGALFEQTDYSNNLNQNEKERITKKEK